MPRPSPRWTATISRPSESMQDPVVGLGAVEVEDDRVDVVAGRQRRRVEERREGAGAGQVVRVVDLQDPGGVGADQRGAAEEAVAVGTEAGDVHRVRGAGLQQVLGAVLPARPDALVVVDAVGVVLDGGAVAPDEAVEGCHGDGRVGAFAGDRGGHAVDVLASDERAGALDQQHHVDGAAVHRLVRVEGVQHRVLAARGVARDGRGTLHAVQPSGGPQRVTRGPCGGGDGRVVGRDDDVGDLGSVRDRPAPRGRPAVCRRPGRGSWPGRPWIRRGRGSRRGRSGSGSSLLLTVAVHSSPIRRITGATRWTPCRYAPRAASRTASRTTPRSPAGLARRHGARQRVRRPGPGGGGRGCRGGSRGRWRACSTE